MTRPSCLLFAGMLVLLSSCGDQDAARNSETAPSSRAVTYRLIPSQGLFASTGSVIEFVPPEAVPPAPPAPLEGTFDVVATSPAPPNSGFAFTITRIDFSGGGYVVYGTTGGIETTTFDSQTPLLFTATVAIRGQTIQLAGGGGRTTFTDTLPPTFTDVVLNGNFYYLRISAAPVTATG